MRSAKTSALSSGSIPFGCRRAADYGAPSWRALKALFASTVTLFPEHGMTSSAHELPSPPLATEVSVTEETLVVELLDGRTLTVPIGWFPRLRHGTHEDRAAWRMIGRGEGIHWETLDEDISVDGLVAGRGSAESQVSLKRWLTTRGA